MNDDQPPRSAVALLLSAGPTGHGSMKAICPISADDYKRYRSAYQRLYQVFFWNPFAYFKAAAQEFHSVWSDANDALASRGIQPMTDHEGVVFWITKLRSAALSMCLSLCYHQEQTYRRIRNDLGAGSEADKAATAIFGQLYDDYPGYRYIYSLRNVMVHDAMDAIGLAANTSLGEGGEVIGVWTISLNRLILSKSQKLKSAMRAEFAALNKNPNLQELFMQIANPMADANAELLSIMYPDLTESCAIVLEFDALFGGQVGIRALAEGVIPDSDDELKLGIMAWSNEVLEFARQYEIGQPIRR